MSPTKSGKSRSASWGMSSTLKGSAARFGRFEKKQLPAGNLRRGLTAAAILILTAAAGLPAGVPGVAHGGEANTGPLRVAVNGWENNLTPFSITFASQPTTVDLLHLVYDTLFWSQAKPAPEPWLAESADPSADRKSWTVKLRSGVIWHDGRPFTAEDVRFTFEYYKRHAGASGRYGHHVAEVPNFARGQVLSETEVRLFFDQPVPAFKILPGGDLPMLPKHIWQAINDPLKALEDKPIGTGPYKVAQMAARQRYLLQANPNYFKGKPLADEIDVSVSGDPNVAFNDLVAGKLDLVTRTVPPIFVEQLTANPQLKVVKASRMESLQLNFNARKPPLSDEKLRKAVSLAIDNAVLVKTVLGGRGRPGVDSFIHPESAWALPGAQHEFDVAKANRILDAAGYSRRDSDGIRRSPDGKRLDFSALFSTLEPQSLQVLQLISQMTTAIGVRLEPEPATPQELRAVRRSAPGAVPGYDTYVSELEVHTHSDPDGLLFFFHSPGKGIGAQVTGYSNPTFDRLTEEASTTVNAADRKRKLHEAQRMLAEEVPSMALLYPDGVYAFRPSAYSGWVPDPGQGIFTKRSFLEDYAGTAGAEGQGGQISPAWVFLGGVAALVLVGSGVVLFKRRPRAGPEFEPADPDFDTVEPPVSVIAVEALKTASSVEDGAAAVPPGHQPRPAAGPEAGEEKSPAPAGAPRGIQEVEEPKTEPAPEVARSSSALPETPEPETAPAEALQKYNLPQPPEWPAFSNSGSPASLEEPPELPPLPVPVDLPLPGGSAGAPVPSRPPASSSRPKTASPEARPAQEKGDHDLDEADLGSRDQG